MSQKAHKPVKRRRVVKRSSSNGRNGRINATTLRNLSDAARNLAKNAPLVRRRLRKAGVTPEPALVVPTAIYFDALDRLAGE